MKLLKKQIQLIWFHIKANGKVWDVGVKELSLEEIFNQLTNEISVDDYAWSEQTGIEFKGNNLANYLERYLFMCPSCEGLSTMHSHGNEFECKECSYKVRYNTKGTFEQVSGDLKFEFIYEWNEWQQEMLKNWIKTQEGLAKVSEKMTELTKISRWKKGEKIEKLGKFEFSTDGLNLQFAPNAGNKKVPFQIPIDDVESVNVFQAFVLNFFYEDYHYHVKIINKRRSAFLWMSFIITLQKFVDADRENEIF